MIPLRALAQPSATLLRVCPSFLWVHSPPLLTLTPSSLLPGPAPSLSLLSQQQDTPPSQRQ